jgi:RNA ligase
MERTHASEVIDFDEVDALVASGHVAQTRHAVLPYRILNYTVRTVIDRRWTDTTERCRGLVIDDDNFIVARPIRKFHNYTSVRPPGYVLTRKPLMYDKLDGSLGIVVPLPDGGHIVSTRGSFVSDQAIHATEVWAQRYQSVTPPLGVTLLVEIVYPANRIVVDNGDLDDLVLLAAIRHDTGADVPLWEIQWPGPVATLHPQLSLDNAYSFTTGEAKSAAEGTVLLWTHPDRESYRLKIKHPDYVRKHAAIFRLSSVSVWRFLSAGRSLEALLDELPDEVHRWARSTGLGLLDQHRSLVTRFEAEAARVPRDLPRAEQAVLVKQMEHPGPIFRLLDDSTIDGYVWKLIRPEFEPFRLEQPSDI